MTTTHNFPHQVTVTDVETGEVVFDSGATFEGAMAIRKMFMSDGFTINVANVG
jgi:hypothetical protein